MGQPHPFGALFRLLVVVLALLIGDRAGSLAGGLARGLALATATVRGALLQGGAIERLDVGHWIFPPFHDSCLHYSIREKGFQ